MISTRFQNLMKSFLSSKALSIDTGLLILRLCCALMLLHGWPKFIDFKENSGDWPDPFHVGTTVSYALTVFAELFCSVFVVLGLFTRIALVPLIICLIVIVFNVHGGDPLEDKEHGLLYLLIYLSLFLTGPGKYSLDSLIEKRWKNDRESH
jgi:putative oxidoreductase